ncbi:exodeoxyribonuclease V subunit alpha [Patulibacter sp.]|uniref:exodeoxyribonuclease V subunit alpha n=1 Tax=Patulibacter sp. TaxID=1912859 RepID=UPI002716340A|nr:exodeoxyribonuclease V subunit alpha [Patulibacter sp.]MDO9410100.1 exodeoxyribonuclease V subunit alpha [Patulibacter sp.]
MSTTDADPFDARLALRAEGALRTFNEAGVLSAADVHVARRLGALVDETDDAVLLAVALAVRAPRVGHVHTDLASVATSTVVDAEDAVDLGSLPWPAPDSWVDTVAASALVVQGDDDGTRAPLRLLGTRLALDRYWHEERRVAADLRTLDAPAGAVDEVVLEAGISRLFLPDVDAEPGQLDLQAEAARTAVRRRLAVIAGGPGTGKTTTVRKIVALLLEQANAAGAPAPLIALAAPTGKAAARMEESLRETAGDPGITPDVAARIGALTASTLHRLLGSIPEVRTRFRHHRTNRLPHDVVIVDETSMVSLSLMARLVEAVRPDARLILVGDPGQLVSVEAGAVLGDIVGPARSGGTDAAPETTGSSPSPPGSGKGLDEAVVVLQRVRRFGREISAVAQAVSAGDADGTVDALRRGGSAVEWFAEDVAGTGTEALQVVRERTVRAGRAVFEASAAEDAAAALRALSDFRLLCAHRRGPYGAADWTRTIEGWLTDAVPGFDATHRWYVGRPLLVTTNDYGLRLFNGDTGVVVGTETGEIAGVFERAGGVVRYAPSRLGTVDTVHAMTVHKAQGSQFGEIVVVLPPPGSPLLTRELLYTAVTRAERRVTLVGSEEAIRAAVVRPAGRATGLRERLWGAGAE